MSLAGRPSAKTRGNPATRGHLARAVRELRRGCACGRTRTLHIEGLELEVRCAAGHVAARARFQTVRQADYARKQVREFRARAEMEREAARQAVAAAAEFPAGSSGG